MINFSSLNELREKIKEKNNSIATTREKWINNNTYYYDRIITSLKFIIPDKSRILHIKCSTGYILSHLNPEFGVGVDDSDKQIEIARNNYPGINFEIQDPEDIHINEKFEYIIISSLEDIVDIKSVLNILKNCSDRHTRIILINYNYLWNPLVKLAEYMRLKIPQKLHNWISIEDVNNILKLSDYELILTKKLILFPLYFPLISSFLNKYVARLPLFRNLTMMRISVARIKFKDDNDRSISIIIPCKNEAGNIQAAVERIPQIGKHTEIIFCDDKSTDGTKEKIREMIEKYFDRDIKLVDGPGICKADNVWSGFDHASGDILCILDADLTVLPEELPYFYEAISQDHGEFINGSRLVYPMHEDAMRILNVIGNKFFSMLFSYILDTQIKDTLCGTKVFWRKDYEKIKRLRNSWGIKDRWGDYELIFGAAKNHLKIIDLPVHYVERTYGYTKMKNRLKNGLIMLKMSMVALRKIKFY